MDKINALSAKIEKKSISLKKKKILGAEKSPFPLITIYILKVSALL